MKDPEDNEEDLKIGVFDSTVTSTVYLIGTTISGDPNLGKKLVKIVKKIEKWWRSRNE